MSETVLWFKKIMDHARKNYNSGGWDYFVECFNQQEFDAMVKAHNLTSYNAALLYFKNMCKTLREREEEIRGWASW